MDTIIFSEVLSNEPWQIYTGPGLNIRNKDFEIVGQLKTGRPFWIESTASFSRSESDNTIGHIYNPVYNLKPPYATRDVTNANVVFPEGMERSKKYGYALSNATLLEYIEYVLISYNDESVYSPYAEKQVIVGSLVANRKINMTRATVDDFWQTTVSTNYLNGASSLFSNHIENSLITAGWDKISDFSSGNFAYKQNCFGVKTRKLMTVPKFNFDISGYLPSPTLPDAYKDYELPIGSWIWFKKVSFQAANGAEDKNLVRCYGWSNDLIEDIEVYDNAKATMNLEGPYITPTFIPSDIIGNDDWHNYTISTMIND